jgi:hypothetical protein
MILKIELIYVKIIKRMKIETIEKHTIGKKISTVKRKNKR